MPDDKVTCKGWTGPGHRAPRKPYNRNKSCQCEVCGGQFMAVQSRARWCSKACQQRDWYAKHPKYRIEQRRESDRARYAKKKALNT